jgi:hypothetical protein
MRRKLAVLTALVLMTAPAAAIAMSWPPQGDPMPMPPMGMGGMPPAPIGQTAQKPDRLIQLEFKELVEGQSEEALTEGRGKIYDRIEKECAKIKAALGGQCLLHSLSFMADGSGPMMAPPPMPMPPPSAPDAVPGEAPPPPPVPKTQITARIILVLEDGK